MSKQNQSISPIKKINQQKSYQTPGRHELTVKSNYQQQFYKQKCLRIQLQKKQLHQQIRILNTQNKQLKTQIQIYRQTQQKKSYTQQIQNNSIYDNKNILNEENQRLLKEIRIIKNNHEVQIMKLNDQNRKIKRLQYQYQQQITQKYSLKQNQQVSKYSLLSQQNQNLRYQLKQMKKSLINYMGQRDQQIRKVDQLKLTIKQLNSVINSMKQNQNRLKQQKLNYQDLLNNKQNQLVKLNEIHKIKDNEDSSINWTQQNSPRNLLNSRKQLTYMNKNNKANFQKIKQSTFSSDTFNNFKHTSAQQSLQHNQNLYNQINRLQHIIEQKNILHENELKELEFNHQRIRKQLEEKEGDLISVLTRVKPLLLEKHKFTTKQTQNHSSPNQITQQKLNLQQIQSQRQNYAKNAYGFRILQTFLKKYKVQAYKAK